MTEAVELKHPKPEIVEVGAWIGRLGNHIIQLSNAIFAAENYGAKLIFPPHPILGELSLDFRKSGASAGSGTLKSRFFFQNECFDFPVRRDSERRPVLQKYIMPLLGRLSVAQSLRAKWEDRNDPVIGDDTLVINVRSGADLFRPKPPPQADYMQPPLSFYLRVIDELSPNNCVIVTEEDGMNPVIPALLAYDSSIRLLPHTTVEKDINAVLSARKLILAHSTFSWILALMSKNLKQLHTPASFPITGVSELEGYAYRFDDYIQPGTWTAQPDQLGLMLAHPVANVRRDPLSRDPSTLSCLGL